MKINERALSAIETYNITSTKLVNMFRRLAEEVKPETGEIEFTMSFDKDGKVPKGELLPEIIIRLKEKN